MAGRLNTGDLIEKARKEVWTSILGAMPREEAIVASANVMENERYLAAARLGWLQLIADELNATTSEIDLEPALVEEIRASLRPEKPTKGARPIITLVKTA